MALAVGISRYPLDFVAIALEDLREKNRVVSRLGRHANVQGLHHGSAGVKVHESRCHEKLAPLQVLVGDVREVERVVKQFRRVETGPVIRRKVRASSISNMTGFGAEFVIRQLVASIVSNTVQFSKRGLHVEFAQFFDPSKK